ncbi:unnamed protein product [Prunus armeniaca]
MSDTSVLSTGTRKYLKATGNREIGQPPVHSNRTGEILVEHLCTRHRYTQISKGNWERGNKPTTCAVKSDTRKYPKATGNRETGQPPVHLKLGRWLGKSWLDN